MVTPDWKSFDGYLWPSELNPSSYAWCIHQLAFPCTILSLISYLLLPDPLYFQSCLWCTIPRGSAVTLVLPGNNPQAWNGRFLQRIHVIESMDFHSQVNLVQLLAEQPWSSCLNLCSLIFLICKGKFPISTVMVAVRILRTIIAGILEMFCVSGAVWITLHGFMSSLHQLCDIIIRCILQMRKSRYKG